jgi:hypothetical protein
MRLPGQQRLRVTGAVTARPMQVPAPVAEVPAELNEVAVRASSLDPGFGRQHGVSFALLWMATAGCTWPLGALAVVLVERWLEPCHPASKLGIVQVGRHS